MADVFVVNASPLVFLGNVGAIIDDLAGRRCARALGLDVMGTLGIVVAAHRLGAVPDLRATILELRAGGMWVSDALVSRVLRLAGFE